MKLTIGPGWMLFILFVILKLTHVIAWSWLVVSLPVTLPFLVLVLIVFLESF